MCCSKQSIDNYEYGHSGRQKEYDWVISDWEDEDNEETDEKIHIRNYVDDPLIDEEMDWPRYNPDILMENSSRLKFVNLYPNTSKQYSETGFITFEIVLKSGLTNVELSKAIEQTGRIEKLLKKRNISNYLIALQRHNTLKSNFYHCIIITTKKYKDIEHCRWDIMKVSRALGKKGTFCLLFIIDFFY